MKHSSIQQESFTILVTGSVLGSQANESALRFAIAALEQGKSVKQVFFYSEGASVANSKLLPLADELHATKLWQGLQRDYGLDLSVCIASAERRGVVGAQSADDHQIDGQNFADGFSVVGLAQFHNAMLSSSHLMRFA